MKTLKTASLKAGYSRTDRRCASLCTATNKKFVTFLFWTALKTNFTSKCSDFQKKLIDTMTTSNFYLKFKEKKWKWHGCTNFLGCFLFQPTAEPNRQCCHSTPYIFHEATLAKLQLKTHKTFSMFPILGTNLWREPYCTHQAHSGFFICIPLGLQKCCASCNLLKYNRWG